MTRAAANAAVAQTYCWQRPQYERWYWATYWVGIWQRGHIAPAAGAAAAAGGAPGAWP